MLSKVTISTNGPIRTNRIEHMVDQLRASIISNTTGDKSFTEDEKRFINFRPPPPYFTTPPKILYAHPVINSNKFEIFAFNADGKEIIKKIAKVLEGKTIDVAGNKIKVLGHKLVEEIPFLPAIAPEVVHYYTATPMILHDKQKDFNEWFAISKTYRHTDIDKYNKEMKRSIANLLRANISYQLKHRVKDKEYPFVDTIDIEIEDFFFRVDRYNKDQRPAPMLVMKFSSSWKLPTFIGHHSGKGYGMLLINKKVA